MSVVSRSGFGKLSLRLLKNKLQCCNFHRICFSSTNQSTKENTDSSGIWANPTVMKWMTAYEDLVGLTEVKNVQKKVVEAEQAFQSVQQERRGRQQQMQEVHVQLKGIHAELEKLQRGDEQYLSLLTQEHQVIRQERELERQLTYLEDKEHLTFATLSSAVRESHEKERTRAERTKYWSVSASVVGVLLGIVGTSINNYVRMRQLKGLIREQAEDSVQLKGLLQTLSDTVASEHSQVKSFIGDLKYLLQGQAMGQNTATDTAETVSARTDKITSEQDTRELLEVILKQDQELQADMTQIKDTLSKVKVSEGESLHLETDLEGLLGETERHLEYRMKINALWTVTAIYAALALTIPVLYGIFSGGS